MITIYRGTKYRDIITSYALQYGMKPSKVLKFKEVVDQILDRINEHGFDNLPEDKIAKKTAKKKGKKR